MIAPSTMLYPTGRVPHTGRELVRLSDSLRDEAKRDVSLALDGVTQKQIRRANVPGMGVTYLSRAANGDDSNFMWRFYSFCVLLKRLGLGRERAQRLADRAQEIVDLVWGPATDEAADLEVVLDKDAELDGKDELPRLRASRGCADGIRELIRVESEQRAHSRTVIMALRHRLLALTEQG